MKKRKQTSGMLVFRIIIGIILVCMVLAVKFYPEICNESLEKTIYYATKHNFNFFELKNVVKAVGILND